MKIEIEKVKNRNLSKLQKFTINRARVREWGKRESKNFERDYEPDTLWIFIKDYNRIVSLGGLRPISINYLRKKYNILGICSTISIIKEKGYGGILIREMIKYFKKTGKSALGFTEKTEFFKKTDLSTKKDFIKRFVYINSETKEKKFDNDGDGIFYNGKDNFIKKVLSTRALVPINILYW